MGCVVPCSPDAVQHTQPHLQPATVTRCSRDVLNNPSIPVLWLKQFWNCVLKLCRIRQMGSKINSNVNDCTSYGGTWRETLHESPKFCSHLCENADLLLFSVLYILISAQMPVHHWPDTCLTIKLPSMVTNMNTFVTVRTGGWGRAGVPCKKDKAAIQLHIDTVLIQLNGAHS